MKGFIYLLEISVALILILVVMGTLTSFKSKENWERSELIATGNNVLEMLKSEDILDILNNNTNAIDRLKPQNINYTLKINGVSENNITVGCIQHCDYVRSLLSPLYLNSRWINFSVEEFSIASLNYIPSYLDAVVFVNYTDYASRKSNITNYLKAGGVVIGVNATIVNNNGDFNDVFDLKQIGLGGGNFNFTIYDPSKDEIEKYFLSAGFLVNTTNTIDSKKWGYWYVWEDSRRVNITPTAVDIENKTGEEPMKNLLEGSFFNLKNTLDNRNYTFKVKKILWDSSVVIQPVNTSFIFKDFSEANDVTGKTNILALPTGQAAMASNNTAVWISDFPNSDEYKLLVKSAIASRVKEWFVKEANPNKEYATVSSFYPLCCDMPETAEVTLYLWYKI